LVVLCKYYHESLSFKKKERSGGTYIETYTWDIKRVEMAWNTVLNLTHAVSISGQDTTDISLDFPHYAVSLLSCQEFLPTKKKNVSFKWLICKYFYNEAPYYKPEMYNLSSTSSDQITDKYNTSNEQRKLHAIMAARNGKIKPLRICSNNTSMSTAAVTRCPFGCRVSMR